MTQAPLACLAIAPVSSDRVFPPISISLLNVIEFLRWRETTHHLAQLLVAWAERWDPAGRKSKAGKLKGAGLRPAPWGIARYLRIPSLSMIVRYRSTSVFLR